MELDIRIRMNEKLYLRNPEESALGRKIVKNGLLLINKLGFEEFTFKKLAAEVATTEASIYRYFENKHRLLIYLISWYWNYLEYKVVFGTNNLKSTEQKLKTIIRLLVEDHQNKDLNSDYISEKEAYRLLIWEGSKAYLTRNVTKDNKNRLFKPYKDLCNRFSEVIREHNPSYPYSHSLASTILEMAHSLQFFKQNLPALTDFPKEKGDARIISFLESLLFNSLAK